MIAMRVVTPGSRDGRAAEAVQPGHETPHDRIERGTGMWRRRIRFAQEHQPLRREAQDADRLRCLGLAQCRQLRRRIEFGCRVRLLPSVRITTSGGRAAAQQAAISPPQPRLSSSGCGARMRQVPAPITSSSDPIGSARQRSCSSPAVIIAQSGRVCLRNMPPPRSGHRPALAGEDRCRDRGIPARPGCRGGTPPGQASAAPGAWHQGTPPRPRCVRALRRRLRAPDRRCGLLRSVAAWRTQRRLVSQAIMALPRRWR